MGFPVKDSRRQRPHRHRVVLKGGQIYGVSQKGVLFCLDAQSGKTPWTTELGGRGFGSIVDAGLVLLALTPQGELTVFQRPIHGLALAQAEETSRLVRYHRIRTARSGNFKPRPGELRRGFQHGVGG